MIFVTHNAKKAVILMTTRVTMKPSKSCVSVFSGILGLEMGLHKAWLAIKFAIDIDESAKETVALNFPEEVTGLRWQKPLE